jgi:hypothetical protein
MACLPPQLARTEAIFPATARYPKQESAMKATDQNTAGSSAERIWKALRPSRQDSTDPAGADEPNEMRRLMLSSQEFRAFTPSAETKPADQGGKKLDGATMDIVFACLAICADEERRAMSFGSIEGANAMRRAMHAIKKKFGVS